MIEFFRDVLNGPLYIIVVIISIILIMAIIGFMMERKQKEKYEKDKIVFVDNDIPSEEELMTDSSDANQEIPVLEPVKIEDSTNE